MTEFFKGPPFRKASEMVCQDLLRRRDSHTPDWLKIKLQEFVPLFVYDSLKIGGFDHEFLERTDVFYLGEARTCIPCFMMKKSENGLPVGQKLPKSTAESGYIFGDVFAVNPMVILELDRLYMNTDSFDRTREMIFMMDQSYKTNNGPARPSVKAYTYLMNEVFWKDMELRDMIPEAIGATGKMFDFDQVSHAKVERKRQEDLKKIEAIEEARANESSYGNDIDENEDTGYGYGWDDSYLMSGISKFYPEMNDKLPF